VVVAPAFLHLPAVLASLRPDFAVAAQDCWSRGNGAFTGEVSAEMLADAGVPWAILGHSERRHVLGEDDALTAAKVAAALGQGLSVMFCIGETLAEREGGATLGVCTRQLAALAAVLAPADWARVVVAYEPVWAIGTGKVASPAQAQEVHAGVRAWAAGAVGAAAAAALRIMYGGSVNGGNCVELAGQPDIDGFLVGGEWWYKG
jgi:triosephosphate isomerase